MKLTSHPDLVLDLLHARIASFFMPYSIAGSVFSLSGIKSVRKSALLKEKEHEVCEFCILPRLTGEGWGEVSTLPVILLSSYYSELPFNASRARQGRDEVSTSLAHSITRSLVHFFQSLIVIISKGSNIFTPMGGVVW